MLKKAKQRKGEQKEKNLQTAFRVVKDLPQVADPGNPALRPILSPKNKHSPIPKPPKILTSMAKAAFRTKAQPVLFVFDKIYVEKNFLAFWICTTTIMQFGLGFLHFFIECTSLT